VVGRSFDDLLSPRDRKGQRQFYAALSRYRRRPGIDLLLTLQVGGRELLVASCRWRRADPSGGPRRWSR
jgi:hypothetical protein